MGPDTSFELQAEVGLNLKILKAGGGEWDIAWQDFCRGNGIPLVMIGIIERLAVACVEHFGNA